MSRENDRTRLFTRRAVLVGGTQIGLFSLLLGRLYYLQVLQREKFTTLAEENRINLRLITPPRGQILDRFGEPLAVNQKNYRVVLLPEQISKLDDCLTSLNRYIDLTELERRKIERDFRSTDGFNAVLVRDNLTWEQVAAISLHALELPGVDIEAGEVRTYPYTVLASHVVGYVGPISQADKDKGLDVINTPGFKIGKNGVEKQYDSLLRGKPGNLQLEMNARGRVVRELARDEPTPGQDMPLTIDVRLQQMVQNRIAQEDSAAAVVLDAFTGAVYALVSHPGFDPNLFTYGISQQDWDTLNNDEHVPLLNKVLDGVYAPGSVFKIVTGLAGLDSGLMKPKETVFCPGYMELGNHRFHCWKRGGHGAVDFVHAMAGSCDTYFYDLGKRVGIDRLYEMAKRLGLGQATGIDFPHERSGLIPSRGWKMSRRKATWQQGETLITSIGQGYVLTSPMQLAIMLARVVNGGFEIHPHIALAQTPRGVVTEPQGRSLGLDPKHLATVRDALCAVVNQQIGTAYGARIMEEGLSMAGKTGTAQVRRISTAERSEGVISNEALPWKERDHALFVGYGPVEKPRYVASVIVEHGGSGAHMAAPIVRDILSTCQKLNPAGEV